MVFRKTNPHLGRVISVTLANSTNRHLLYGRIRLDQSEPAVAQYDSIYILRDSEIEDDRFRS